MWLYVLVLSAQAIPLLILYPAELPSPALCPLLPVPCSECPVSSQAECESALGVFAAEVVLDLGLSQGVSDHIAFLAGQRGILHIVIETKSLEGQRKFALYPSGDLALMQEVLTDYNWTKATVIGSVNTVKSTFEYLSLQGTSITTLILPSKDALSIQSTLARGVKSTGANILILNTDPADTAAVLKAAETLKMIKAGYAYFLTFQALPIEEVRDGLLFLSPICGEIAVVSRISAIRTTLIRLFTATGSVEDLRNTLISTRGNPHYCLYNSQQGGIKLIAELYQNQVRYFSPTIDFLGSNEPPGPSLPLAISIFNSTENPTLPPAADAMGIMKSANAALDDINKAHSFLPGFDLKSVGISFGIYEFDRAWAQARLEPTLSTIGLGIVGSPASGVSIGVLKLLQDLGVERPMVSSSTSPVLSSTQDFPMFVRILMSDAYMAVMYLNFLVFFGWTRCSVLYMTGDIWSEGVYQYFQESAKTRKFTIANNADSRGIDDSMDPEKYIDQVQGLIDCKARVAVLILYTPQLTVILKMLYDRGIRTGDLVFLAIEWLTLDKVTTAEEPEKLVFQELLKGAITCVPHGFVGAKGAIITERLRNIELDYSDCLYYDAVLLLAHALRSMLLTGKDFEDPYLLSREMRASRFVACSGIVTFEPGTNDRSQMSFELNNLKYWADNDTWAIEKVVIYNPSSILLYKKAGDIQWFDGSSTTPSDIRPDPPCPNDRELEAFPKGRSLLAGILVFIALVSGLIIWYIWKNWWQVRFSDLASPQEISVEDYIMFAGLGIEWLQLLGIGPDITEITSLVANVSHATSLNLSSLVYLERGTFWLVLDAVLSVCVSWFLAFAITVFNLWSRIGLQWLEPLAERWLPFIGDNSFLPIVSFLLNIYICDRSYSHNFTSSVLNSDCFVECWQDSHWVYVAMVSVCLAVYIPVAVYTRPAWQRIQTNLHVKTHPFHLMMSTLFQIVLIIENKLIKKSSAFVYAWMYLATVGAMAILYCFNRPHNYRRVNLWHVTSYLAAIWMALVSVFSNLLENQGQNQGLLLGGWSALLVFTVLIQRFFFPSLLFRRQKDTRALFRFAFQPSHNLDLTQVGFNRLNFFDESKPIDMGVEFTLNPKVKSITLTKRTEEVSATPSARGNIKTPLEY